MDAVRWVLGARASQHLRGQCATDVILGSSKRPASGQARVALTFTQMHLHPSEKYKHFTELTVERLLTREGTSQYRFNGQLCRKRDVMELFMGTA